VRKKTEYGCHPGMETRRGYEVESGHKRHVRFGLPSKKAEEIRQTCLRSSPASSFGLPPGSFSRGKTMSKSPSWMVFGGWMAL
jgi:hypothetical protein